MGGEGRPDGRPVDGRLARTPRARKPRAGGGIAGRQRRGDAPSKARVTGFRKPVFRVAVAGVVRRRGTHALIAAMPGVTGGATEGSARPEGWAQKAPAPGGRVGRCPGHWPGRRQLFAEYQNAFLKISPLKRKAFWAIIIILIIPSWWFGDSYRFLHGIICSFTFRITGVLCRNQHKTRSKGLQKTSDSCTRKCFRPVMLNIIIRLVPMQWGISRNKWAPICEWADRSDIRVL